MSELHFVSRVLADTRSQKAEVGAAEQQKNAYISQLSTALQALLLDSQISDIIEFLGDTEKRINLGYFRDKDRRGWYIVLTGKGFQKFEDYGTIPFEGGSKRLSHLPRIFDLNTDCFAAQLFDTDGEQENAITVIRTRIIEAAESYASEVLEEKRLVNSPTLLERVITLIFG